MCLLPLSMIHPTHWLRVARIGVFVHIGVIGAIAGAAARTRVLISHRSDTCPHVAGIQSRSWPISRCAGIAWICRRAAAVAATAVVVVVVGAAVTSDLVGCAVRRGCDDLARRSRLRRSLRLYPVVYTSVRVLSLGSSLLAYLYLRVGYRPADDTTSFVFDHLQSRRVCFIT
jgi:hypothetical protein